MVHFDDRLRHQDQSAKPEHHVANAWRDVVVRDGDREDWVGETCKPSDAKEECDADAHRHQETSLTREVALRWRQFLAQDRDIDDVVDPEHDLERRERDEANRTVDREPLHEGRRLVACDVR